MNYAEIKTYDIANGPGVRVSLFVSGCTHKCKGCFNEIAWDFNYGNPFTKETEDSIIEALKEPCYQGLTLLGGEPMEPQNQKGILPLLKRVRRELPDKDIWMFSGYLYDKDMLGWMSEELDETKEILPLIDVIVDGKFEMDKKDITLLFKGSSNQRTIDVKRSLESGEIVTWDPGDTSMQKSTHL